MGVEIEFLGLLDGGGFSCEDQVRHRISSGAARRIGVVVLHEDHDNRGFAGKPRRSATTPGLAALRTDREANPLPPEGPAAEIRVEAVISTAVETSSEPGSP